MPHTWTQEQLKAIYEQGDLLVSAAAGAGKTSVLAERLARIISEGVGADELLVVTYTKAAAAEMKQRIRTRLYELSDEAAQNGDNAAASRLQSEAAACDRANISTIHSFCRSVLKRNYHEAEVDPEADIADAAQTELLISAAMDAVLERAFAERETKGDADLDALITAVGGDDKLEELIKKLYLYAVAKPDPEAWLNKAAAVYTNDFYDFEPVMTRGLLSSAKRELAKLNIAARELAVGLGDEFPKPRAVLEGDAVFMDALIASEGYDGFKAELDKIGKFDQLRFPNGTDEEVKEPYRLHRDRFKDCIKRLKKMFARSLAQEAEDAESLAGPIVRLCALVKDFISEYAARKAAETLIDYADLEQLALKVLKNPAIADEYRKRFKYVFVDEYQDINPAQEAILSAVSNGNRFMVGDVKQSIYRFRQAEPEIFLEKYNTYSGEGNKKRIDLNRNFRSDAAVLEAVNAVFAQLMRGEEAGRIDYGDNASLIPGLEAAESGEAPEGCETISGVTELILLDPDVPDTEAEGADEDEEPGAENDSAAAEAAYTAKRILRFMQSGMIMENGVLRPCKFSDFTVLLRSAKSSARRWLSVLTDAGIPCVSQLGGGLTDAMEVRVFLDLLRVIDNRRQDIPLLAVMRSHIYSFTEDELIHVCRDYGGEKSDILDRVTLASQDEKKPEWSIKCARLLSDLERWRALSRLMGPGELIGHLLDETEYEINCAALYGGEVRGENLTALWETACRLSAAGVSTLSGFIKYMDDASASSSVETPQAPAADAVRLMTVHRSKGLEFNVVFLGGITRKFNTDHNKAVGIFDAELGIGLCSVSGNREAKCLLQRAIAAREDERTKAEEMRVLYVAMTRAKHALIMLGAQKNARRYAAKAMRPLDGISAAGANCFADWLLGAYFPNGRGEDGQMPLPCGGRLDFKILPAPDPMANRNGMSLEEFDTWGREARFAYPEEKTVDAEYKNAGDTLLPAKLSVTGLTLKNVELAESPRFMQLEKAPSGAEIGTLTHRLLQLASLKPHTEATLKAELEELTEKGFFTPEEANAVRLGAAARFFASPLGQRLTASDKAEREKQFNILMPASELTGADSGERIMLQGVIDCCFTEDGEWVLIDFKTTRVEPNRTAKTVAEQYRRQLELYAAALEMLTGSKVKESWVYMLSADEAVEM